MSSKKSPPKKGKSSRATKSQDQDGKEPSSPIQYYETTPGVTAGTQGGAGGGASSSRESSIHPRREIDDVGEYGRKKEPLQVYRDQRGRLIVKR